MKDEVKKDNTNDNQKNKDRRLSLLTDMDRFKNKKVTITFVDGNSVTGRLVKYDEVANCILKKCVPWDNGKSVVIMGRSIVLISLDAPYIL